MFDGKECIMFDCQKYIHGNAKLRISLIKLGVIFVCLASIYSHWGRYKSVDIGHVLSEDQI